MGKENFRLEGNEDGNLGTFMYFSSITMTTLGYGDIVPITILSRIISSFQSILGLVIIGFFLNSLTSKQIKEFEIEKERKIMLTKILTYNEVRIFTLKLINIWIEAYNGILPTEEIREINELISNKTFDDIRFFFDITKKSPIKSEYEWNIYLEKKVNEILKTGNKILDRYNGNLDYRLIETISELIGENYIFKTLCKIRNNSLLYKELNVEIKSNLKEYFDSQNDTDLKNIKEMIKWCNEENKKLSKEEIKI